MGRQVTQVRARISPAMSVGKLRAVVDKMVIKSLIQGFYARAAREKSNLIEEKRKAGYCGGSPSCMEYTGPDTFYCAACKHAMANPKSSRSVFEYGRIRTDERTKERAAAERGKKPAPATARSFKPSKRKAA